VPRTPRDGPGTLHHAMNRAVGRRPFFEDEVDLRDFEDCLAASVDRGEIRLQSFSLITNHFHLLVESRIGNLAEALRRIESEYAQRFNGRHDRDGPLVRGRFRSKLVEGLGYWFTLVRYIDHNPVEAGLAATPSEHRHGSAFHYARHADPHWLDRSPVEQFVCARSAAQSYRPSDYADVFKSSPDRSTSALLMRRVLLGDRGTDPFKSLLDAAPDDVRRWLVERARLADGMRPGLPIAEAGGVLDLVQRGFSNDPRRKVDGRKRSYTAAEVLSAGLLRQACAETVETIARLLRRSETAVRRMLGVHAREMATTPAYADVAQGVVHQVLAPWRIDAPQQLRIELERKIFPNQAGLAETPLCRETG
jgi:REP element-mobilizing transposase RayT